MFKRLILDDGLMIFPLVAFITAACVFVSFAYRAWRMQRSQIDRFARLPFHPETAQHHEHASE